MPGLTGHLPQRSDSAGLRATIRRVVADGAREIEITLRKATAADWPDLIKTWYV